jgi:hypothetical protein
MNGSGDKLTVLRAELARRTAEVVKSLLGQPNLKLSGKRQLRFGRKGSLVVVTAGPKIGAWFDHENGIGGDLLGLIRRQRGGGFLDAVEYAQSFIGHMPAQQDSSHASAACLGASHSASISFQRRALKLWNEGLPIAGTLAAGYLAMRGIAEPTAIDGEVLRFHPSCPYGERARHPCMLALLRDFRTDQPHAIHRTALTPAGDKIGRMVLGPKSGAAIKLSPDDAVATGLTIAEGIETALSGMQLGWRPAWSVVDAAASQSFLCCQASRCSPFSSITTRVARDSA